MVFIIGMVKMPVVAELPDGEPDVVSLIDGPSPGERNFLALAKVVINEVLARNDNVLHVRCMDMINGTPILDIKPFIVNEEALPSREGTT